MEGEGEGLEVWESEGGGLEVGGSVVQVRVCAWRGVW